MPRKSSSKPAGPALVHIMHPFLLVRFKVKGATAKAAAQAHPFTPGSV